VTSALYGARSCCCRFCRCSRRQVAGRRAYRRAGCARKCLRDHPHRKPHLPSRRTVLDFVPGYATSNWFGIGAPRNTPVGIVERLNREINAGLADPRLKARLTDTASARHRVTPKLSRAAHLQRNSLRLAYPPKLLGAHPGWAQGAFGAIGASVQALVCRHPAACSKPGNRRPVEICPCHGHGLTAMSAFSNAPC
jgi:hypothetical protein